MEIKNPMFNSIDTEVVGGQTASMKGITIKTAILLGITFLSAIIIMILKVYSYPLLIVSSVICLVVCIFGMRNPKMAPISGSIYAACQGIWLGSISVLLSMIEGFEGAASIAVVATLAIFLTMLALYSTKIVRATSTLAKVMMTTGMAIFVFFIIGFILNIFGNSLIFDMLYGNTMISALLAVVFIAYGAFMLVFNFNEAESYVEGGFDKSYEWAAAFSLIVSIIYIYIQVLRFVIIILGRRK